MALSKLFFNHHTLHISSPRWRGRHWVFVGAALLLITLSYLDHSRTTVWLNDDYIRFHDKITSCIHVIDGDTIVIGGILKSTVVWSERGIPGLRRMGVLGWLFKFQSETDDKNELLIFITPRIVQLEQKRL